MDLFLTIGRFNSIAEMLDTFDVFEYEFLLEKYRLQAFGPSMWNYMLAQIAWVSANTWSNTFIPIERMQMGEIGAMKADEGDQTAVNMIRDSYYRMHKAKGLSKEAAQERANEDAREYGENLRKKRLEEAMQEEQTQDLSNTKTQLEQEKDLSNA